MQSLQEIKKYTLPKLCTGKEWVISFYAFSPVENKLKRKRIKLNSIASIPERRKYAKDLMLRLNQQLVAGWNPWIEADNHNAYLLFKDVVSQYRDYLTKLHKDGIHRTETYNGYTSSLRNFENWNDKEKISMIYIYQLNRDVCVRFLEEVYIIRDNTPFTRDNYLVFLQQFCKYLLNHNYIKTNPTDGISGLGNRSKKKIRTLLTPDDLNKLDEYLNTSNKHYLLACYILYYCFIRPKEMSKLKLSNISLSRQTIFVPDFVSKNKKDGTITLPAKLIHLMIELKVFDAAQSDYLFSDNFMPGATYRSEKSFRDFWARKIRKDLGFPDKYKFYSLKDTGITNMLRHYDVLSVRDQARHSSILMTDIYTPHDIQKANDLIKNYEGEF